MKLKQRLLKNKNVYTCSDLHFQHANICRGTSEWDDLGGCRDFESLEEMNSTLLDSINSSVMEDDVLIYLGDWSFGGKKYVQHFRDKVNCKNIHFVLGNHDHYILQDHELRKIFSSVSSYIELFYKENLFVFFHYGMRVWNQSHHGSIHCFGHSHGSLPPIGRSLDVGWDVFKRPLSLEEIIEMLEDVPAHEIDHHNSETN